MVTKDKYHAKILKMIIVGHTSEYIAEHKEEVKLENSPLAPVALKVGNHEFWSTIIN